MNDLLYSVGLDATELNTGAAAVEARLAESGVRMAKEPEKYAAASAAAFKEVYAGEDKLAAFRAESAFKRMSDEEKLAVLRHQALGLLGQIQSSEGRSGELAGIQIEYEKKKNQIFDLNKKVTAEQTIEVSKQTAEQSVNVGLLGKLQELGDSVKKGFHEMGVAIKGAGVGIAFAAIVSLGKEAIANAQKQRDEYERLGKPIDGATRSMATLGDTVGAVGKAAVSTVGFFLSGYTQLGDVIGSLINRMRGIGEAQENYAAASQRAADIAEARVKQLKEEQHDIEKIATARKSLSDAEKQAALDRATDEKKFSVLAMENVRLREQLKNTAAGTVLFYERQEELLKNGVELNKQGYLLAKQNAELQLDQLKNEKELAVTYQQKAVNLAQERNALLTELNQLQKGSNEYKETANKLDANGIELIKLQRDWRKGASLEQAEQVEMAKLQIKSAVGLTEAEGNRLAMLKLQQREKELQYQIDELIEKKLVAGLNPEEQKRLASLFKQKDTLDKQVAVKEGLISAALTQAEKEKAVAAQLAAQTAEMEKQAAARRSMDGAGSPLGLHNLGNVSTDVLQAQAKQLQDQMSAIMLEYQQKGWNPDRARSDNYFLASQIQSIKDELSFRQDFSNAYSRGGRAGALQQWIAQGRDAASFDTAIANMSSWAQGQDALSQKVDATNKALNNISGQLAKSGLFPNSGSVPIT